MAKVLVGDAIQHTVETGVGVSDQDAEDVQLLRVGIFIVEGHDEGVGRPAEGEHDEYDEERPGQLLGLLLTFAGLVGVCRLPRAVHLLHFAPAVQHVLEDHDVADADEEHGKGHADGGEEDAVGERRRAVPDAGQRLPVVHVVAPAQEVWQLGEKADGPEAQAHGERVAHRVDLVVEVVLTDVDVAVQGDGPDGQQGAEAGGETQTGDELTKGRLVLEPDLAIDNTCKEPKGERCWIHQSQGLVTNYGEGGGATKREEGGM